MQLPTSEQSGIFFSEGWLTLTPQDVIWRVLQRLQEDKEMVAASVDELHPVRNQDLISTLYEVERLMQTQIHLLHRMKRRYD